MGPTEIWIVVDTDTGMGVKTRGKGRSGPALYYSHGAAQRVASMLSNQPGGQKLDGGGRFVPRYEARLGRIEWS